MEYGIRNLLKYMLNVYLTSFFLKTIQCITFITLLDLLGGHENVILGILGV
jgi:hypothetical protein